MKIKRITVDIEIPCKARIKAEVFERLINEHLEVLDVPHQVQVYSGLSHNIQLGNLKTWNPPAPTSGPAGEDIPFS